MALAPAIFSMRPHTEGEFHPPLLFKADSGSGVASATSRNESFWTPNYEGVDPDYRVELERLDGVLQRIPLGDWPLSMKKVHKNLYGIFEGFGMKRNDFQGLVTEAKARGVLCMYVGQEVGSDVRRRDYFVGPNTLRVLRSVWKTAQDTLGGKEPRFIQDYEWKGLYFDTTARLGKGSDLAKYLQSPTSVTSPEERKTFPVDEFFEREHIVSDKRDERKKEAEIFEMLPYREMIARIKKRYLGKEGATWTSAQIADAFRERKDRLSSAKSISVDADTRLPESIVRILHFVDWVNFHKEEIFLNKHIVFSSQVTEGEFVRSLAIGGRMMQDLRIPVVDTLFERVASFAERKLQQEEAAAKI